MSRCVRKQLNGNKKKKIEKPKEKTERNKKEKDHPNASPPMAIQTEYLQLGATMLFVVFVLRTIPFFISCWLCSTVFLTSFGFFVVVAQMVEIFLGPHFQHLEREKKLECENRATSLVFNLSTGIPSILGFYELWSYFPPMVEVSAGRTWMMDIFAAWSLGYIVYDYLTLKKVYSSGIFLIQIHHVAEALCVLAYTTDTPYGSLYLLGGGLMQLSSGVLHVQRIWMINKMGSKLLLEVWKWFLAATWFHGRLWEVCVDSLLFVCLCLFPQVN
jgi:hypothetical protein